MEENKKLRYKACRGKSVQWWIPKPLNLNLENPFKIGEYGEKLWQFKIFLQQSLLRHHHSLSISQKFIKYLII
jgi:hypothetical protein